MKKLLMLVLSAVFMMGAASTFVACDNREVLYVATNAEFPPFEYRDNKNNIVGFDIDLINEIGKILNINFKVEHMSDFDSVLAAVQSGKSQLAIAGITVDDDRKIAMDFTDTYFTSAQVLVYKTGDNDVESITGSEEEVKSTVLDFLKDKKIGFQSGTTGHFLAEDITGKQVGDSSSQVIGYKDILNACLELEKDASRINYVIADELPAKAVVKNNSKLKIKGGYLADTEAYAIAVNKSQTGLVEKINQALKTLNENGKMDELKARHLSGK